LLLLLLPLLPLLLPPPLLPPLLLPLLLNEHLDKLYLLCKTVRVRHACGTPQNDGEAAHFPGPGLMFQLQRHRFRQRQNRWRSGRGAIHRGWTTSTHRIPCTSP
jgi:hypothetical protein